MREMSDEEQLRLWVDGQSVHRKIVPPRRGIDGEDIECCPDFSCCKPELQQPVEVRRAFVAATRRGRDKFLAHFLGCLVAGKAKVYITDGTHEVES